MSAPADMNWEAGLTVRARDLASLAELRARQHGSMYNYLGVCMSTQSFRSTGSALNALAGLVTSAKKDNAFARVTILVPSNASALDVTRYLARSSSSGSLAGTVAVSAVTVSELANRLFEASGTGLGREELSLPIRQGAVATALKDDPGLFHHVWSQPATAAAVAATSELMDGLDFSDGSPALPTLVATVWNLHNTVAGATSSHYYSRAQAFEGATVYLSSGRANAQLGQVIAFMLPSPSTAYEHRFLAALTEVPGYTSLSAEGSLGSSATVLTASDSDDETRAAVRKVAELVAGTQERPALPAHRIGVFYTASDPYRTLVTRRLDEAGITFSGPDSTQLADMPIARGLATLLQLTPEDLDVRAVLNILAEGALHWSGQQLPSSTVCERLYLVPFEENDSPVTNAAEQEHVTRRREHAHQFASFQSELGTRLTDIHKSTTWASAASLLHDFVHKFFAPRSDNEMPSVTVSRDTILEIIASLAAFDGVAPPPSQGSLASALESAVSASHSRRGKIGTGVNIGPLHEGVGRDLDVVLILGLVEGLAPSKVLEDPLFPDKVKSDYDTGLPAIGQRWEAQSAQFRALLGTAPQTILFAPRGNLRGGGSYELSRWITAAVSQEWKPCVLPSFDHGIRTGAGADTGLAPTAQEWGIRNALTANGGVSAAAGSDLARAVEIRRHRREGLFDRFTGNLSSHPGTLIKLSRAISPSSLEDWAANPFGYFLKRVLQVGLFEDLGLELQIGPAQRGEMVHSALEGYVQAVLQGSPADEELFQSMMGQAFSSGANPAWLPHLWNRDKAAMQQTVRGVLAADQEDVAGGWTYMAPEAGFGPLDSNAGYDHPPVLMKLPDGTEVAFQGKVDRIDKNTDGRVRIIDYKTGGKGRYEKITQETPTAGGRKFQLSVYGLFAEQFRDSPEIPVQALYWFIGQEQSVTGYDVDDDVKDQFRRDVALILQGIGAGVFPHIPEEAPFLTYTAVSGKLSVERTWERLRTNKTIREFPMLAEATDGK